MESHFFQRFLAYFVDAVIITILLVFLTGWMPQSEKYKAADKQEQEIQDMISSGKFELEEVSTQLIKAEIIKSKETIVISLISIVVTVGYFGTFAYYRNGQTIGKKMMQIKVVNEDGKEASHMQMIFRTLVIKGALSSLITTIMLMFITVNQYPLILAVDSVQSLILMISIFTVIFRKDKKGLHDMWFKTKVIAIN